MCLKEGNRSAILGSGFIGLGYRSMSLNYFYAGRLCKVYGKNEHRTSNVQHRMLNVEWEMMKAQLYY
jgi:hypothetical protein